MCHKYQKMPRRKRSPSPSPEPAEAAELESDSESTAAPQSADEAEEFDEPSDAMVRYASERHRRFYNPRTYRRVMVYRANDIIGADLATMGLDASSLSANRNFAYASCYIDCFTRYAWVYPLKNKTAKECFSTFEKVVADNDGEPPDKVWSDMGSEFVGSEFKAKAAKLNVEIYHTLSERGSTMVERFIRTLRELLVKLQTERTTLNWVDLLPKALDIYNHRPHSAIGMTPAAARALDDTGQQQLWYHMYGAPPAKRIKPSFSVGDWVVVARVKQTFEKRSSSNAWGTEKYQVSAIDAGVPPLYTITDAAGKRIDRQLYAAEMAATTPPPGDDESTQDVITHILDERGTGKDKEYYVAWYESEPSWVDASVVTHPGLFSDWKRRQAAAATAAAAAAKPKLSSNVVTKPAPPLKPRAPPAAPEPAAPSKRPPPRVRAPPESPAAAGLAVDPPAASSRPQRVRKKPAF